MIARIYGSNSTYGARDDRSTNIPADSASEAMN
jgi:hypothetical protein